MYKEGTLHLKTWLLYGQQPLGTYHQVHLCRYPTSSSQTMPQCFALQNFSNRWISCIFLTLRRCDIEIIWSSCWNFDLGISMGQHLYKIHTGWTRKAFPYKINYNFLLEKRTTTDIHNNLRVNKTIFHRAACPQDFSVWYGNNDLLQGLCLELFALKCRW